MAGPFAAPTRATTPWPAKAVRGHLAQQHQVVPRILDQIRAKARAYGSLVGVEFGEAFMRSQAIPVRIPHPELLMESEA